MNVFLNYLSIIGSILFVVVAVGMCIFFHELGHFIAARICGLRVLAFSIGFKTVWHKKINGVDYRIGCIPCGGYCEIPQVDSTDSAIKDVSGEIIPPATPLARVITAAAGPLFNIILGLVVGCLVWCIGIPQSSPKLREFTVYDVPADCPEYKAGLRPGDIIQKINGESFHCTTTELYEKMILSVGEIHLQIQRNGKTANIHYQPIANTSVPGPMKYEGLHYPFFKVITPFQLSPQKNSPAEKAGVKEGDLLVAVKKQNAITWSEYQLMFCLADGKPIDLTIKRNEKTIHLQVTPEIPENAKNGEFDFFLSGVNIINHDSGGAKVAGLMPDMPAQSAGIKEGDIIYQAGGHDVKDAADFSNIVKQNGDKPLNLAIKRANQKISITLIPKRLSPRTIGVLLKLIDYPTPWDILKHTLKQTVSSLQNLGVTLGNKLGITKQQSSLKLRHLSGPLGIATVLFDIVYKSEIMLGIYFATVVSFALGIFNLLPLPVLDGGHITIGCIELIVRRKLPQIAIKILTTTFVVLLIGLMIYVSFFDLKRIYYRINSNKSVSATVSTGEKK